MSDFAVSTAFTAKQEIEGAMNRMTSAVNKFGNNATNQFNRASKAGTGFGNIVKGNLAASAISRGTGLLTQGVRSAAVGFIDFDKSVRSASAKFGDFKDLSMEAREKALLPLRKAARDVGATTRFSAAEAAAGLDFLALAGFKSKQAMAALPGVTDLAVAGNLDLATATDIASDSLGAFNLMTDDDIKLKKNLSRINDNLAKTSAATNTSVEALFESIKKGGPTFTSAGQSVESFTALVGIMANAGVKGEESGTQLRNVMLRLAAPTKEASEIIDKLGIKIKDQKGDFRDVISILGDFEKGLKGMGTQQRTAALSTVFGARSVTGINILLDQGEAKLKAFRAELEKSGGSAKMMAAIIGKSIEGKLKTLQSAALELGFKFIEAFERDGVSGIESLTKAINDFNPAPIISGLKVALGFTKALFQVMQPFLPLLPVIIGAWLAYAAAMKAVAIAESIKVFVVWIGVIRKLAATQGILNAIMAANPIGAVVVGIGLLVAAGILLVKNWDKVWAFFVSFWDKTVSLFKRGWGFVMELLDNPVVRAIGTMFAPFITIPLLIIKKWEPIKLFFMDMFQQLSLLSEGVGKFFGILGLGGGKETGKSSSPAPTPEPPNKREAEARTRVQFNGSIELKNFPEGATVKSRTSGAEPIDIRMLGPTT